MEEAQEVRQTYTWPHRSGQDIMVEAQDPNGGQRPFKGSPGQ